MKRVKIAAALLIIILIYSIFSLFVLKHLNGRLISRVEAVEQAYNAGNQEEALRLSHELDDYWQDYEKKITMIIHDDALADVNIAISKITPFVENQVPELDGEIRSIYYQLEQIYEEEFPSWYNIL